MNYNTLFPKILKQLPEIHFNQLQYKYISNKSTSNNQEKNKKEKRLNIYLPYGSKYILWFVKYNNEPYSLLLEVYQNKIKRVQFQYTSFRIELTSGTGTLIYGTKIDNSFCCERLLYYMGHEVTNTFVTYHMNNLKHILELYVNDISDSEFMKIRLPIMSYNTNAILEATSLTYPVYGIINQHNYIFRLNQITRVFDLDVIDTVRDIYSLNCMDKNKKLIPYQNAYVNDRKTSQYIIQCVNKTQPNYREIEFTNVDNDVTAKSSDTYLFYCVYIPNMNKWKPYRYCKHKNTPIDNMYSIKQIENQKYNI